MSAFSSLPSKERVEKLLDSVDATAVASQYTAFSLSGANPRARCPIHKGDNAMSLVIFPDGVLHCYSCGWHGDVIAFVRKMENKSLSDAVGYLEKGDFPVSPELAEARGASLRKQVSRRREARAYALLEGALEDVRDRITVYAGGTVGADKPSTPWSRECELALAELYDAQLLLEAAQRSLTEDGAGTRWKLVNRILGTADDAK